MFEQLLLQGVFSTISRSIFRLRDFLDEAERSLFVHHGNSEKPIHSCCTVFVQPGFGTIGLLVVPEIERGFSEFFFSDEHPAY